MGPVTVRSNFVQGEIAQVSLQKLCAPQPWMTRSNKSENAVEPRCEQAGEARQRVNRQRVVGMVLVLAGKQISIDQRLPRGCCQVIYT